MFIAIEPASELWDNICSQLSSVWDMPEEVVSQLAREIELLRPKKMATQGFAKLELSVRKLVMDTVSISKGQKKQKGNPASN